MKHFLIVIALACSGPLWAQGLDPAQPVVAVAESASDKKAGVNCLTETGSRIKRSAEQPCISAPGQVITRDDINRTGAIDTAEALRKLSPALR